MLAKNVLRQSSLFSLLTDTELESLIYESQEVRFSPQNIIFHEGDKSDGLYIILEGSVEVYLEYSPGHSVTLNTLSQGDIFGELALLDDSPRSASVTATTNTTCLFTSRAAFESLLYNLDGYTVYRLLTNLASLVRASSYRILDQQIKHENLEMRKEAEKYRELNDTVAAIMHELNTPLGLANTAAGVIQQHLQSITPGEMELPAAVTSALSEVTFASDLLARNIKRAAQIAQSFQKSAAGQLADTLEAVNMRDLVEETVGLFQLNARQAKLEILVNNDDMSEQADEWLGYPGYLAQVLTNFLTNIERYAYPDGGGVVDISIYREEALPDPYFTISVQDYGQGISNENLKRIFEPYFTTGRARGGTGLGLAIVKDIVTGPLKGMISANSKPGAGTQFKITIPQRIHNK